MEFVKSGSAYGRHSSYLGYGVNQKDRQEIWRMAEALEVHDFDAIAFVGISGALVAPALALLLDKQIMAVRKEKNGHGWVQVESDGRIGTYIIVDDFVESGASVLGIQRAVRTQFGPNCDCVGVVSYTKWYSEVDSIRLEFIQYPCDDGIHGMYHPEDLFLEYAEEGGE